jgi:cell division protein FtsW
MNKKKVAPKKSKQEDRSLIIVIFGLLLFGLLMIFNSTVITSNNLYGTPYKFSLLQLAWIMIGLLSFLYFYNRDYKKLKSFAYVVFLVNTVFLFILAFVSVFLKGQNFIFSPEVNGANRWFYLNPSPLPPIPFIGVVGFQPAELAKLTTILYLSFQLQKNINTRESTFKTYLIISGLVAGLVLLQPNMSTAAMIFIIGSVVYYSTGESLKQFFILVPSLVLLAVGAVFLSPYRRARLFTLLGPEGSDQLTSGYHIKQILLALGSGGIFGVGLGQSKQKYQYLPEVASDSIFAVIGEEFGFMGTTVLIIAFGFLIYKGFSIAKNAPDLLGKIMATGITSWIALQFFVNVAAMTKIIPLTGVPMPLISYGGSSMLFTLSGLGILANIDKNSS